MATPLIAHGPAAASGSKLPVKDHSERSRNRLRTLKMWEEEQRLMDIEDVKMTQEQLKTLVTSFESVKCEFDDLDGLSWSTPDAHRRLEQWRLAQEATYALESAGVIEDLPTPPGLEATSSSSSILSSTPPTPDDLPDCPMYVLPNLPEKHEESPSEPMTMVESQSEEKSAFLHPSSLPTRKRPTPVQTRLPIRRVSPISSAALAAGCLPATLNTACPLAAPASPTTARPPATPATACAPAAPCPATPCPLTARPSSPEPRPSPALEDTVVTHEHAAGTTPAPPAPDIAQLVTPDETPRPQRRIVSAPRFPSNPARHPRTARVPSSPRLGALRAPSSPRTGRRAVSGGRTGSKFAIIVVHERLGGHYCGTTCATCH
ncbi:hypothetical protein OBBRIDRAFT_887463 [Obba rivulosa]|uniref:Uncharacterized protein n=1 Tax=Obba rivulosa TaxID=1052685 RepID=A0A8E2AYX5_9APHY|nr:hypothetical protein OBBRIDRAFT_887463 [Obba rivulosa]